MSDVNDTRLIELETKMAYQENTLLALDDVITRQQKQIDQLELSVRLLMDRVQRLSEGPETSQRPIDEKPPHY